LQTGFAHSEAGALKKNLRAAIKNSRLRPARSKPAKRPFKSQ
jgi:hypothetical protein